MWRTQIIWLFCAGIICAARAHSLKTIAAGLLSWFSRHPLHCGYVFLRVAFTLR